MNEFKEYLNLGVSAIIAIMAIWKLYPTLISINIKLGKIYAKLDIEDNDNE